jgi:hypothetical protein
VTMPHGQHFAHRTKGVILHDILISSFPRVSADCPGPPAGTPINGVGGSAGEVGYARRGAPACSIRSRE